MSGAVLVVDDETLFAEAVATRLRREGYACAVVGDLAQARAALADPIDLMLLDVRLPDGSGLDFLAEAEGVPVVMMTAFGDVDSAVAAMKSGAADYLRKPVDLDELAIVAARALAARRLEDSLARSRERDARSRGEAELAGESPAIAAARREIAAFAALLDGAADADAPPVLILGETGTGKTLAARLLHDSTPAPDRPYVHVDCAGLPPGAALAELFGDDDGPGLVEAAERGTVVLDEVSALPPDAQAALVAAIEGRQLRRRSRRSGRRREIAVAASFVAASNRDLEALVEEGGFRRDLYYRLNVLTLRMPPLRDRGGDAALLARRFVDQAARRYGRAAPRLDDAAVAALFRYPWPGNVRELRHVVERAVLLDSTGVIGAGDLPSPSPSSAPDAPGTAAPPSLATLDGMERRAMREALAASGGNVSAAARRLGISRMAMRYRMKKHGL